MVQNGPHLPHRQHYGKALALSGADHSFQVPHFTTQHRPVKKEQSCQGLVLGGGAHPLLCRQMAQEGIDLRLPHLARMAHLVKPQKPS
jgi:hypothetical protein